MWIRTHLYQEARGFFLSACAPTILRFFHLCAGDQGLPESLTIETLGENVRSFGLVLGDDTAIDLLGRAFQKVVKSALPTIQTNDVLLRSLAGLPPCDEPLSSWQGRYP